MAQVIKFQLKCSDNEGREVIIAIWYRTEISVRYKQAGSMFHSCYTVTAN
jgi:hypothetical protein